MRWKSGGRAVEERWKSDGRASKTWAPGELRDSLHEYKLVHNLFRGVHNLFQRIHNLFLETSLEKVVEARAELWTARAELWTARAEQLQQLEALLGELPGALTIQADLQAACGER